MKKILTSAALVLVSASSAFADCAANLGINFTPNQRIALCKEFGSAISQSLIPAVDNTYDLGSASKEWRNLYLGTNLIFSAASAKIIPGATSLVLRNNADSQSNAVVSDAGLASFLTLVGGSVALTPQAGAKITGYSGGASVGTPATNLEVVSEGTGNGGYDNKGGAAATRGYYFSNPTAAYDAGIEYVNSTRTLYFKVPAAKAQVFQQGGSNAWFIDTDGDWEPGNLTTDMGDTNRIRAISAGTLNLTGDITSTGGVVLNTTGKTVAVDSGTAASACKGTVTANGATPVVTSTTCAATGSIPILQKTAASTAANGTCTVTAISDGTSFTIECLANDTGTYSWWILKEG